MLNNWTIKTNGSLIVNQNSVIHIHILKWNKQVYLIHAWKIIVISVFLLFAAYSAVKFVFSMFSNSTHIFKDKALKYFFFYKFNQKYFAFFYQYYFPLFFQSFFFLLQTVNNRGATFQISISFCFPLIAFVQFTVQFVYRFKEKGELLYFILHWRTHIRGCSNMFPHFLGDFQTPTPHSYILKYFSTYPHTFWGIFIFMPPRREIIFQQPLTA